MSIIWGKLHDLIDGGNATAEGPHSGVEIVASHWERRMELASKVEVACGEVPAEEGEWWREAGVRVGHA